MSKSTILSWFCKSSNSGYAKFSRKFHNLSREGKEMAVALIADGVAVSKAIAKAKRTVANVN